LDLGTAIQKLLVANGIVLHPAGTMAKYVKDKP
jgi:hypothetical protein